MADEELYSEPNPLQSGGSIMSDADFVRAMGNEQPAPAPETPAPQAQEEPAETPPETPSEPATDENAADEGSDPPIEPPSSWKGERKATFASLPRDIQQQIADIEHQRVRDINERQREAAEARKAADAKSAAADTQAQHYQSQLSAFIPMLQQQLQGEFSDIKSIADAQQLAKTDPARYIQWDAAQRALNGAIADQRRISEENAAKAAREHEAYVSDQRSKLIEKLPELDNGDKYAAFANDLGKYLKGEGFTSEELKHLTDHRTALIARKAMLYDKAQAAKAAAVAKPVPKVQAPGVAATKAQTAREERAAKIARLAKNPYTTTEEWAELL